MDWTDRHERYFLRLLSRKSRLYSEMVTADAVRHGDRAHLLSFNSAEHPVALQLGGSDATALAEAGIEARMLLQVHDELIFEAEESIAEAAVEVIRAVMESAADPVLDLAVPLVAEAGIADSGADAH